MSGAEDAPDAIARTGSLRAIGGMYRERPSQPRIAGFQRTEVVAPRGWPRARLRDRRIDKLEVLRDREHNRSVVRKTGAFDFVRLTVETYRALSRPDDSRRHSRGQIACTGPRPAKVSAHGALRPDAVVRQVRYPRLYPRNPSSCSCGLRRQIWLTCRPQAEGSASSG